jgi:Plasmid pRiA4b ORF-3-like protein/Type I restriction enzyme R protein N terminus (HSDR_N)
MSLGESDTRAKLIDPALHACGWTEDLIRREETAGAVEVVEGQARRRAKGRVDYTLRVRVNQASQPVAVALIEAKAEHLPPAHGLEQAKAYAACRRLNVQFVFSSNGHLFIEFDRATGLTSQPRSLTLRAAAPTEGAQFRYVYDLGDGWGHEVLVEAIQALATPLKYPVCLAGERACPPEGCGGTPGYANLLDVLRDRTHPEHKEMLRWVGRSFDPERFDLTAVNRKLRLIAAKIT